MTLSYYINALEDVYHGEPWYGQNLIDILEEIKDANPNATYKNGNTLGQILEHMTQWKRFVVERIKGNNDFYIALNSKTDWNKGKRYNAGEFADLVHEFRSVSLELISLLKNENDLLLDRPVEGKNYTVEKLLSGILQHDLYHAGQLNVLKRTT